MYGDEQRRAATSGKPGAEVGGSHQAAGADEGGGTLASEMLFW